MKYARSILLFVACPALQNFTTFLNKLHVFRKEMIEYKTSFFIFSTTFFKKFLILIRTEQDIVFV
jgi:hypothetical protein